MPDTMGIRFLFSFTLGNYNLNNPGSNIISVTSTADGDYNKTNLTTTPLREVWRSGEDISSFIDIIVQADDTSIIPDVFAILNHNFSETAIVQLQGSSTVDFSSPAFTLPLTWTEKHMVLQQDVAIAYNYYRFRILDPMNTCGFLEIGRIVGGRALTMIKNEDIVDDLSIDQEDLAYKIKTEGFFRAFNERVKIDKLSISFSKLQTVGDDNDNYVNLLAMFKDVGETYPFLTIVDPQDQSFALVWGVIDKLPRRNYTINRYVSLGFTIEEVY